MGVSSPSRGQLPVSLVSRDVDSVVARDAVPRVERVGGHELPACRDLIPPNRHRLRERASSGDNLLLIAELDLFTQNRQDQPRTLRTVADELNISEETAVAALERLEGMDVLVRVQGGTTTPIWTPR